MINPFYSIYILSLMSGLFSGFSKFAVSMWLRDCGADLAFLNYFTLTLSPALFSAFWLPFLENYDIWRFKFGIKKNLIIFCDMIIAFMTFLLPVFALNTLSARLRPIFFLFLIIYAAVIASRDAMGIGYKMEFISKFQLPEYDGIISAYYQIGMMFGGAGVFFLSQYLAWKYLFIYLGVFFLINAILDCFLMNSSYNKKESLKISEKFIQPYRSLIEYNRPIITYLFMFLLLCNFADRMLVGNLNFYMLDAGLKKNWMAPLKILTGAMTAIIGLMSAYIIKKFGLKEVLFFSVILYGLIPFLICLNIYFNIFGNYQQEMLGLIYILDKIFKSMQGTAFFSYQMKFCIKEYAMSHKALFTFFERGFAMIMVPMMAWVLDQYGYAIFFLLVTLTIIPSCVSMLMLFNAEKNKIS